MKGYIMRKNLFVSIVFSFRNEEEVIPELIRRVHNVLKPLDIEYELIFVNDDSTDRSLEILREQRVENNRIKILNMSRRFGLAHCVIAGYKHAQGDAVIYMHSDLQDPPELVPELLKKWKEGYDVVHTTRKKRKGENALRMWFTRRGYEIINLFSDIYIPKNTGDFKLLSRRALNAVLQLKEYDPFLRGLSSWVGFKQTYVLYESEPRFKGQSHHGLLSSTVPYKDLIRGITTFSSVPLYIALFMGFIVSIGTFIYLIKIFIEKFFFGLHLPGWPALMVTMLFLGGTILFTIGIQGIYIGKIHEAIKNRPRYIIESKEGFEGDID